MSASPALDEHERLAPVLRSRLQGQQSALKSAFEQKPDARRLLRAYCRAVDALLRDIWQQYGLADHVCLIAVGGYGRGELFPHSDVDLLILMPENADAALYQRIESLIGLFWDIGLAVGHSVRTLDECIAEADNDVTIRTNLLEARLLAGNLAAYAKFDHAIASGTHVQLFFAAKLGEQEQRHARFHDTAYNLEPNVKESPGGLRDLQTILWIARSMGLGASWHALVKCGLISEREARQIRRHELHLQLLRIRLHYLANRREDRLLFDFQNDLARQLGYADSGRKRASEQLMHGYYRSAKYIGLINEILLKLLQERMHSGPDQISIINSRFQARNGLLEARAAGLLQKNPSAILESFLLLQQHGELHGMGVNLLRNLHRVKNLVNLEFRQDPANKALFLQILQQPTGVTSALSLMNRYGILGRYIPAFGRIVGQMQHDLFHVYTVDEHILNVLGNLRRFAHRKFAHEFPLCSKLFGTFDRPHLLYLGALFHDIAKGRGGDHSKLGTTDARRFCKMHGLAEEDTELVAWLVEAHLLMSATAQKSDLADTTVIERFAKIVGSERRLTALYLLTVADIRGTSPKIWNAWKAKLLEHLYSATRHALRGNATNTNTNAELQLRQQQAHATLNYYGIAEQAYLPLWEKLGRLYFMRHESQEIAWHSRLLLTHINTAEAIVRARLSPGGDGIQVMIYMRDRDDLFAHICGFFERIGYTIVEAKVHTTQHGYALDSFLVLDPSDHAIHYRDLLNYIEYELTQKLLSTGLPSPPQGRISRQVKHMPIPAEVTVSYDASSRNHVLDVVASDRPGLLSRIAQVFLEYGVHLHTAKINTLGNRIEDTFLISGKDNRKLGHQVIQAMKAKLLATLG